MIDIKLTDNNPKEFEKKFNEDADKAVKHFERDLLTLRTGRAHPALVENVKVLCYGGTAMALKEISAISVPEARLLVIQPWDKGLIADIERALQTSDLGVNPVNDGNIIRIQLPGMSSARRDELIKVLHKKIEDGRIAIRNIRKDFHNLIREAKKKSEISEDHSHRLDDILQKLTDAATKQLESVGTKKETEIKG